MRPWARSVAAFADPEQGCGLDLAADGPATRPSRGAQSTPPLRSASLSASLPKRSSISAIAAAHLPLPRLRTAPRFLYGTETYGTRQCRKDSLQGSFPAVT